MRGKPTMIRPQPQNQRNIPAYAGKTRRSVGSCGGFQEHPRACGENVNDVFGGIGEGGTSPRMRGKQGSSCATPCAAGNIPAHAGKTLLLGQETARAAEHPRVCGENDTGFPLPPPSEHPRACGENGFPVLRQCNGQGTSPRMRGKPMFTICYTKPERNIPAHAGKTKIIVISW